MLSKVLDLLPRLEQGEAELKLKDENDVNIEICDENSPAIEMVYYINITLLLNAEKCFLLINTIFLIYY